MVLLTVQQSYVLLATHCVFARECCDRCGQLLGAVRFARKNDSGVWCSRECRDGARAHVLGKCQGCGASLGGKRRGTKWCGDYCRLSSGSQGSPNRKIIPRTPLQNKGFADAKSASLALGLGLNPVTLEARAR